MSKLSVKHSELLTQGTHVGRKLNVPTKNAQNVFVTFMEKTVKEERTTAT